MKRTHAILISGAPATGKSTLAAALAPRLGAAILDIDSATGPLTTVVSGLIGVADLSEPTIAEITRGPRYDTLLALAEDNLRTGLSVILVAPFTAERSGAGWNALADRLSADDVSLTLIWLDLPAHHLIHRLKQRDALRDQNKVANPDAFLAAVDRDPPAAPHLALDATEPVAELVERVVVHLMSSSTRHHRPF